jgi:hypothetical protein
MKKETLSEKDRQLLITALTIAKEQYDRDAQAFATLPEPARTKYVDGTLATGRRCIELAGTIEEADDITLSTADGAPEEAADMGPEPLRMYEIVARLASRGIHSFIEHTGGNVATLYAGYPYWPLGGGVRYPAMAGPGYFVQLKRPPVPANALADPGEFMVGMDDDGSTAPTHCTTVDEAVTAIWLLVAQAVPGRPNEHD